MLTFYREKTGKIGEKDIPEYIYGVYDIHMMIDMRKRYHKKYRKRNKNQVKRGIYPGEK